MPPEIMIFDHLYLGNNVKIRLHTGFHQFFRVFDNTVFEGFIVGFEPKTRFFGYLYPVVFWPWRSVKKSLTGLPHTPMKFSPHTIHTTGHRVHVEYRPAAAVGDRKIVDLSKMCRFLGLRVAAVVTAIRL